MGVPSADGRNSVSRAEAAAPFACPECGAMLLHIDGCVRCRECGFSPCE